MIGEGNQAYVDNNLAEATRIMQEVIRIEPCAASAWTVLAQCYADLNEQEKSLQLRVMAAHLLHDAEEWDRLARQSRSVCLGKHLSKWSERFSRDLGYSQQALYCYGKVYTLDPEHVDAMWDRASLAKEVGDMRAVSTYS
jgi:general transcription factor 3C polypeptide 3 (transcription factor C subunit 4)